jgi:hypothetical protein
MSQSIISDPHVFKAYLSTEMQGPARVRQDAVIARFVELVLEAHTYIAPVTSSRMYPLDEPMPLIPIVHLEAIVVTIDQRAACNQVRLQVGGQVHAGLQISDGISSYPFIGRRESPIAPFRVPFDVEVDRRDWPT